MRRAHVDGAINELAASQHALITQAQALLLGLTERQIQLCVQTRVWRKLHPRVFLVGGAPESWEQRQLGACLWAGSDSGASHRAAARLHQLDGFESDVVEITSPRRLKSTEVIVHRAPLRSADLTEQAGIPVTNVPRTMIDIGAVVGINQT